MTPLPYYCVVDASVGIKLILDEPYTSLVRHYFGRLNDLPPVILYVPDLFFVECANILWKKVRRGEVTLVDSQLGMAGLNALMLPTTSTAILSERALALGSTFGISAYDATSVALAERLGVSLLTADNRLATALVNSPHQVIMLDAVAAID
jgi:predicted nucleic acid-binding protein